MSSQRIRQVVHLARRHGLLRTADVSAAGIPRHYLRIACQEGLLERVTRGIYRVPGTTRSEHQSLAEVSRRVPCGIICLLSALRFHELTTQNPSEVWIAIGEKAHRPRIDTVAVRIARFSGRAFTEGVEVHKIDSVPVKVYSPAKTVADCFKYRNKVGLDVAMEALRDCLRQRKTSVDELVRYARICRVDRVVSPYLEAML